MGPPPSLGRTVGVQAKLHRGGRRDPSTHVQSYLFLDTQIHVGVASHVTPAMQIQRPCLDSLQMQQEYPWKHRSQTAGCSWEGAEAAQEGHHLGGLVRK